MSTPSATSTRPPIGETADARIYLLPGRGETLTEKVGASLLRIGLAYAGRPLTGDFEALRFSGQLAVIADDLQPAFWTPEAILIGRSYGGYLLLHTLADLPPFPGSVLLLSPVLGAAATPGGRFGSIPPRGKKLLAMAETGGFPSPRRMEIHTGQADDGCDPELARRFGAAMPETKVLAIPEAGHWLGDWRTETIIRKFICAKIGFEFNR